ncbi:MAG: STN domain-containing protein [Candidatus Acidiferrum sp.]
MDEPIAVNLQNKTVRQSLDAILRHGRGYSWRLRNGVIEITNRLVSKHTESQFDTVIPVFTIPDKETTKMASVMLWWNLQLKLDKTLKGFAGDVMGDARAPRVKGATLQDRTVREILAYIVVNSDAEGWIVPGPPECVGFTPYCGLWVLIEGEPTDPSYKILLRSIRENL